MPRELMHGRVAGADEVAVEALRDRFIDSQLAIAAMSSRATPGRSLKSRCRFRQLDDACEDLPA